MIFKDLKITFIAGQLGQGGAERQLFYILKTLSENGADVCLLSLRQGEFWESKIKELGVRIFFVGKSQFKIKRLIEILKRVKADKPQIIQSQHFFTNLYAAAAARLSGCVGIGAIRSTVEASIISCGIFGKLNLFAPAIIVANSKAAVQKASRLGVDTNKLRFLPNAVDCDEFCPAERPQEKTVSILAVGHLSGSKRFDLFLDIIAGLNDKNYVIKAVIVGDGPKRSELEKKASQMKIKNVEFAGMQTDLKGFYQQANIMVMTSDFEGTPNVILEAMACGLPVVSTNVGGVSEVIQDGETGFLSSAGDTASIESHLERLIKEKDLRTKTGKNAREYVLRNHSLFRLKASLSELYDEIQPELSGEF